MMNIAAVYASNKPASNPCSVRGNTREWNGLTYLAVPRGVPHAFVFQAGCLDAIDERAPHSELTNNLIQWRFAHEGLLSSVC